MTMMWNRTIISSFWAVIIAHITGGLLCAGHFPSDSTRISSFNLPKEFYQLIMANVIISKDEENLKYSVFPKRVIK